MSRFFNQLEFDDKLNSEKESPPKTVVVWDKDKLKAAYLQITNEISRIRTGRSEYVPRAINPGSFGFPAENLLKLFIEDPTDKTFREVHAICRQDFSARAGDYFYDLLVEARREEVENLEKGEK